MLQVEPNASIKELLTKAWEERRASNYDRVRALLHQAEEMCRADDFASFGRINHVYMQIESDHDRNQAALEFSKQSVAYYEKAQLSNKLAHATRHLADLYQALNQWDVSEDHYRKALAIYRLDPDTRQGDLANALRGFGTLLEQLGRKTEAISVWRETQALYQTCGLTAGVEEAKQHLEGLLAVD